MPIKRYGATWNIDQTEDCNADLHIELAAFRKRLMPEKGGLGPYKHLRNASNMIWPAKKDENGKLIREVAIDHPWKQKRFQSLCDNPVNSWTGCAACVAGHTRIFNPITGEQPTIKELCDAGISPTVMTLKGPAKAGIPFVKGVAELFDVVLEDGKTFRASAEHLVLISSSNSNRWSRVCDLQIGQQLLSYDSVLRESTLDTSPLIHVEDVPCSLKKVEGFQGDCHRGFRFDDEQLLHGEGISQSFSPLQVGVQKHILDGFYLDDFLRQRKCSHFCQNDDRLSKTGTDLRHNLFYIHGQHPPDQETVSLLLRSFQPSFQSQPKTDCFEPFGEPNLDFSHKRNFFGVFDSQISNQDDFSYKGKVSQIQIVSICKTRPEKFYDLCVPNVHHYFAEGTIHHNSGKTYDAGHYAMLFWLADPLNTAVILTSTTGKMVRKRIWPVIQELFHATNFPGNLVDSKTTLQAVKGDDKHGIFALAVADGNTAKAVANIQGIHAKRMLLVIDEATDTPEAVFQVIPNLRKGCDDFRVIIIGNALSILDPHGRSSEPKEGWNSITVDDEEWETRGVPEWELDPGISLHFDGTKSPNIKLGVDKWPFLYTNRDLANAQKSAGGAESIGFWKYTRGFWCPDGTTRAVLSELMIKKHTATGKLIFVSKTFKVAALDPAFGGDKCVLRFGDVGDLENGKMGVQLTRKVVIPIRATLAEPVHYQIARQVKEHCIAEGVLPENFCMDVTGEGGGTADIISVEWSPKIKRCEFGGAPSNLPVSSEDERLASDAYDRKVTELWFSVRNFVVAEQLKGLDQDEVIQFSKREFTDEKRKIKLDTKREMKEKIGRSPDDGDAVAVLIDLVRNLGVSTQPKREPNNDWKKFQRRFNKVYANIDYSG